MQRHLLTFIFNSAFDLLFFASISASHDGLTIRYPTKGEGYRCGTIVLSQDLIVQAARQAAQWSPPDILWDSYDEKLIQPVKYTGQLDFGTLAELWLWPVWPEGQTSSETGSYYIVLRDDFVTFFGVIWQYGDNLQEKCIKESDLSDLSGKNNALGYRCPHTIYPFEIIIRALSIKRLARPIRFVNKNIFGTYMELYRWPISSNGDYNCHATESIIMDAKSTFFGMVYKRHKGTFRCRLTIKTQIRPEFVGRALEQTPKNVGPLSLDVFQCGEYFIPSDQILADVAGALEKKNGTPIYKDFQKQLPTYNPTGDGGPSSFYIWTLKVEGSEILYQAKSSNIQNFAAVIDDYANVYDIIMSFGNNQRAECERKTMDSSLYESRKSEKLEKFRNYQTSNKKALAKQGNLLKRPSAGDIFVQSSRAGKKQKYTSH